MATITAAPLPSLEDAERIFLAFQGARDELEPVLWTLKELAAASDGSHVPPISDSQLAALLTIRCDLARFRDDFEAFAGRLDEGCVAAVAHRADQQLKAAA